jgi:hypothetical protein
MAAAAASRLRELLAELRAAAWVADAVAELDGAGHASLAQQLRVALTAASGADECAAVVAALWRRAEARDAGKQRAYG